MARLTSFIHSLMARMVALWYFKDVMFPCLKRDPFRNNSDGENCFMDQIMSRDGVRGL